MKYKITLKSTSMKFCFKTNTKYYSYSEVTQHKSNALHLMKDRKHDSVDSDLYNIRCMEGARARVSATWSHPNLLEPGIKAIEMGTHKSQNPEQ
jgi:hypothetical protein